MNIAITNNNTPDVDPVYSPDGKRIAYAATGGGGNGSDFEIFMISTGGGPRVQCTFNDTDDLNPSWQPRP